MTPAKGKTWWSFLGIRWVKDRERPSVLRPAVYVEGVNGHPDLVESGLTLEEHRSGYACDLESPRTIFLVGDERRAWERRTMLSLIPYVPEFGELSFRELQMKKDRRKQLEDTRLITYSTSRS